MGERLKEERQDIKSGNYESHCFKCGHRKTFWADSSTMAEEAANMFHAQNSPECKITPYDLLIRTTNADSAKRELTQILRMKADTMLEIERLKQERGREGDIAKLQEILEILENNERQIQEQLEKLKNP